MPPGGIPPGKLVHNPARQGGIPPDELVHTSLLGGVPPGELDFKPARQEESLPASWYTDQLVGRNSFQQAGALVGRNSPARREGTPPDDTISAPVLAEHLSVPEQKWYFQRTPCPEPIPEEVVLSVYGNNLNKIPGVRVAPQTFTMSEVHQILLPETQLKDIVNLTEPNRARQWMSRVFEPFPGGEVQQVTLWLAYKTQFKASQNPSPFGQGVQMIAPAEDIKLTSDVFPNALLNVTEHKLGEKKFVISGMRVQAKKHQSSPQLFFF
ncbi:Chromatin structure-remodeling complex protein rsc9 [Puccinia graminis f. sp. tritici]|uniref:Chromatin structure-remodeling complex protein rsc9 n=1 Tax=Puccinia graminis f. sp. tritici TaxID=56615 RepID=A0A5B0QPB7_PUCGR|nr:Chromatin structure-remodeling complex protein rsc9 [Puccinia graminis f. sp. tritici]